MNLNSIVVSQKPSK